MGIQGHGDKTLEQGRPREEHYWLITEEQNEHKGTFTFPRFNDSRGGKS